MANKLDIQKIKEILVKNNVKKAGLFGSYATNKNIKNSDVDLLIQFKGQKSLLDIVRLKNDLESSINKKFDIVTYKSLNKYLKESILEQEVKIL